MTKKISCSNRLDPDDVLFALFLDKEQFKEFLQCFNQQYSFLKKATMVRNTPIKLNPKLMSKLSLISVQKDRSQDFRDLFKKVLISKNSVESLQALFKQVRGYKNLLARLLEVVIFLKQQNSAKAQKILQEIISRDMVEHIFRSEVHFFNPADEVAMFKQVLLDMATYLENDQNYVNLIYYLASQSDGEFKRNIIEEFAPKLKMKAIRASYNSYTYGRRFPYLWAPLVLELSSQAEYIKVLEQASIYNKIQKTAGSPLLFLRGLDGISRARKEIVLDAFKRLGKRDDIYGKFVYFQLLEDQSFSQFLNSNGTKVLGLLAAKKRAFFKKQLKNQKMILFSAFELMKLGDIQESLLLYIINHENNIL